MPEQVMEFGGLHIAYDDEVLEPRTWTFEQSRWATTLLADAPAGPVLELCAGAGQIGLAVAHATGRALVQVDVDERACGFAIRNAEAAGIETDVRCDELEDAVRDDERFPFVLADPPYIASHEVDDLPDDPDDTIDGGEDGLDIARTCLTVAAAHLEPDGLLLLQLGGADQASRLAAGAGSYGLAEVETRSFGADRALVLLRRSS